MVIFNIADSRIRFEIQNSATMTLVHYAKWQAKRRQESLDVVYVATLNYEADDDKSEKENEVIPF